MICCSGLGPNNMSNRSYFYFLNGADRHHIKSKKGGEDIPTSFACKLLFPVLAIA